MDAMTYIDSILNPREQWAMSAADNIPGMSLPEYHPAPFEEIKQDDTLTDLGDTMIKSVYQAASDEPDNIAALIQQMLGGNSSPLYSKPQSIANVFDKLKSDPDAYFKAKKDLFLGVALKTAAAAGDVFSRTVGLGPAVANLNDKYEIAKANYTNQMDAIDNQVLYIKHQLADRFNKTVQTNIMNLAAKNLRVTAGNVLDLSKEEASEITEDMRTAESNANLKKIALQAGKESAKESTRYAEKQLYTGLVNSAVKLGLVVATGAGTGESFGDLYKGYKVARDYEKAKAEGTLTSMYK